MALKQVIGFFVSMLLVSDVFGQAQEADSESRMLVHFIDVGQGTAVLIETPCQAILIDPGGEQRYKANVVSYLQNFFVRRDDLRERLEAMIISHFDSDHYVAGQEVLQEFGVDEVFHNGSNRSTRRAVELRNVIAQLMDPTIVLASEYGRNLVSETSAFSCPGLRARVIWGANQQHSRENNQSVALRIDFGKASFLFPGDLENEVLDELASRSENDGLLDVDVLLVARHGSANSNTQNFVQAVSPQIAVITMGLAHKDAVGHGNRHGHPRAEVVDTLLSTKGVADRARSIDAYVYTSSPRSGSDAIQFRRMDKAIYGTGWEGSVVVTASPLGTYEVETLRQDEQGRARVLGIEAEPQLRAHAVWVESG